MLNKAQATQKTFPISDVNVNLNIWASFAPVLMAGAFLFIIVCGFIVGIGQGHGSLDTVHEVNGITSLMTSTAFYIATAVFTIIFFTTDTNRHNSFFWNVVADTTSVVLIFTLWNAMTSAGWYYHVWYEVDTEFFTRKIAAELTSKLIQTGFFLLLSIILGVVINIANSSGEETAGENVEEPETDYVPNKGKEGKK